VVTFGGAYAVLAYVAQQAVNHYHWLTGSEMVHGLALAETTPGPLIMVVQFVAFLGAYRDPGSLTPWVAAVLASLLTVWVTFVPSILFVVLGAPYVERLRSNQNLSAALAGITAAVVGVIANLALYFALHTLFSQTKQHTWGPITTGIPVPGTVIWSGVAITALGFLLVFPLRMSVLRTLGACALAGIAWQAVVTLT
jgi:chromate transporter